MTTSHETERRDGAPVAPPPRLSVEGLSKTFGRSRVLTDVSIDVRPGEIHGLVGQNGSGKSTLAKVLTGLYTPDPGAVIRVDGTPLSLPVKPYDARANGMAVVHQSLGIVNGLSVLENMRVGRLGASRFLRRIDWARERAEANAVFERIGRPVPLDALAGSLSEEERATVAIARALQDATPGTGLIVFDESTRALSRRSLEHFFAILDEIVRTGTAVLMITHRLEEVVSAADRVTVLRDGRAVVSGRDVEGMTEPELAALILGNNKLDLDRRPERKIAPDAPSVRVESVTGLGVRDVSFEVRQGEIVGLTGLGGSGYDDVPYLLSGVSKAEAGKMMLPEQTVDLPGLSPAAAIEHGIAIVPEGREHAGLAMGMTVAENIAFPRTARSRGGLRPITRAAEKSVVEDWIERLDVQPANPGAVVSTFSGGNQQKVFVSKWLATDPTVLLLHEPTQAVDVGARHTIVSAIHQKAADGAFVVVAGSDENELGLLCDRVLVFEDGQIRRELVMSHELTPDAIVEAIYTDGSRVKLRNRG